MKKRLLSLLLCLCMFAPLLTMMASAAPNFTDVQSGAYYAMPVTWAVSQGITNGTSETTFSPDNTCTRAQILTFLWYRWKPQVCCFPDQPLSGYQ